MRDRGPLAAVLLAVLAFLGLRTLPVTFSPPGEPKGAAQPAGATENEAKSSGTHGAVVREKDFSQPLMEQALRTIAGILTSGQQADPRAFPGHILRHQHTAAVRAELGEQFAAATANRMLSALRGVLKEACCLGLVTGDDYQRAIEDVVVVLFGHRTEEAIYLGDRGQGGSLIAGAVSAASVSIVPDGTAAL